MFPSLSCLNVSIYFCLYISAVLLMDKDYWILVCVSINNFKNIVSNKLTCNFKMLIALLLYKTSSAKAMLSHNLRASLSQQTRACAYVKIDFLCQYKFCFDRYKWELNSRRITWTHDIFALMFICTCLGHKRYFGRSPKKRTIPSIFHFNAC